MTDCVQQSSTAAWQQDVDEPTFAIVIDTSPVSATTSDPSARSETDAETHLLPPTFRVRIPSIAVQLFGAGD